MDIGVDKLFVFKQYLLQRRLTSHEKIKQIDKYQQKSTKQKLTLIFCKNEGNI